MEVSNKMQPKKIIFTILEKGIESEFRLIYGRSGFQI